MHDQQDGLVLLSRDQAARRLGISLWSLEKLILRRELTPVRIGRRVLIRVADIDAFVRRRAQTSTHLGVLQ